MKNKLAPEWMKWQQTQALIAAFAKDELRFVGGCVRDALLLRTVTDVDAATPLKPDAVMALLANAKIKAVPTGLDHGTVTAVIDGKHFEITTLRRDVATDGRHAEVAHTDDWKEDAERRDFTMNALYLSPAGELFDYFDGVADARAGRVRFIGKADARIAEDYLRILRFFRFFAHYGKGEPDAGALAACALAAGEMKALSGERIQQEMLKLLAARDCHTTIEIMRERGIFAPLFGFSMRDGAILARFDALEKILPLPAFLKLMGFVLSAEVASDVALDKLSERLKLSNAMSKALRQVFLYYDEVNSNMGEAEQKKLLRSLGAETFRHAVLTQWARGSDSIASSHPFAVMLALADSWQPPLFPVNGDDLLAIGMKPGKEMGALLKKLEDEWEKSGYKLSREELLKKVK